MAKSRPYQSLVEALVQALSSGDPYPSLPALTGSLTVSESFGKIAGGLSRTTNLGGGASRMLAILSAPHFSKAGIYSGKAQPCPHESWPGQICVPFPKSWMIHVCHHSHWERSKPLFRSRNQTEQSVRYSSLRYRQNRNRVCTC